MAELRKKAELQSDIVSRFSEIQGISNEGITLAKGMSTLDNAADVSNMSDKILEKIDEIKDLVFEFEETLDQDTD
jgi:hypothetical protein